MKHSRRLAPMVLLACLLFLISGQAVLASEPTPPEGGQLADADGVSAANEYGLHCEDGICALRIHMGDSIAQLVPAAAAVWLEVMQDNLRLLPDGAGIEIADEFVLKMPVGDISLVDADVTVQIGPDHRVQSLNGTAQLPLPSFGVVDGMSVVTPVVANIGYDQGKNLTHVHSALQPDRAYLYFDLGAGLELTGSVQESQAGDQQFHLSVPRGQQVTLLIDTEEPLVYFDGNVSVRYNGQLAYVRQVLDPTGVTDWMPDDLPLTQTATVHLSGALGRDWDQAYFEVGGGYTMDSGMVGRWLRVDATPLAAEGTVVLDGDGLLLTGNAQSNIAPDTMFDGSVGAQVFIPFTSENQAAYVALDSEASIPLAGVHLKGNARLDSDLNVVAATDVVHPWQSGDDDPLVAELMNEAGDGLQSESVVQGRTWSRLVDGTVSKLAGGMDTVMNSSGTGYDWATRNAAGGIEVLTDVLSGGYELSASTWCAMTNLCDSGADDLATQGPDEVAIANE